MRHQQKSLIDAYMLTRCRRLNGKELAAQIGESELTVFPSVLIQPNLLLLRELLAWDAKLAKERSDRHWTSRYSWPAFCRDVWALNRKYLA